jgi:hypothetical protein
MGHDEREHLQSVSASCQRPPVLPQVQALSVAIEPLSSMMFCWRTFVMPGRNRFILVNIEIERHLEVAVIHFRNRLGLRTVGLGDIHRAGQ